MSSNDNLYLGLASEGKILLTVYAREINADLEILTRQAKQSRALIDAGGVFYINVPKFLQKREEIQQRRDEAKDKRKSETTTRTTIETTTNIGMLRAQRTRLTNLIAEEQKELEGLPQKLAAETNHDLKRKLKTRQDNLPVMIESNQDTLAKVEKRLRELGEESDSDITMVE
jgi:vacuolar-type H+-ATPase subunit I/STV1